MPNNRVMFLLAGLALLLAAAGTYAFVMVSLKFTVHGYAGIAGPDGAAVVAPKGRTPWQRYGEGSDSRLAVLLTDSESSWLGLAHALKSFGVPFRITSDTTEALRHKVVLVYPTISGKVLSKPDLEALSAFPRNGGHLIGVNVLGGGLNEVFGFTTSRPSRGRFAMNVDPASSPLVGEFVESRERTVSLGDPERHKQTLGTLAYHEPRARVLAAYDDGGAAIIARSYGEGGAYAFGFDLGDFLHRAHHARHFAAHRSYVNGFEPAADVVVRLIRNIYLQGDPDAVTLGTVPEGRPLAVMFSFDVDADSSYEYMLDYARLLTAEGIAGTFYIQTKYVRDFNDAILLDENAVANVRRLAELGMEVASHSVSHADSFEDFPLGRGDERYPDYRPAVLSRHITRGGTILGELRVSKYLLEILGRSPPVTTFRPGYLDYPTALPQALAATGYRFSSSMTANKALSHLPFRLNYDREAGQEVAIFEIPVTVEDEKPPAMGERVDAAIALAHKIARYGGSFVVLTHPNQLGHKLEFHKAFIEAMRDRAWFGTIADYGDWWAARDNVEVDGDCKEDGCAIRLYAPRPIAGLSVNLPRGCRYDPGSEPGPEVRPNGDGVVLGGFQGLIRLACLRARHVTRTGG